MYNYEVIYYYRDAEPGDLDLTDPTSWDGQELVYFESDVEIGALEDVNKSDQLKHVTAELGRASGHYMINIVQLKQGIEDGEAFIND